MLRRRGCNFFLPKRLRRRNWRLTKVETTTVASTERSTFHCGEQSTDDWTAANPNGAARTVQARREHEHGARTTNCGMNDKAPVRREWRRFDVRLQQWFVVEEAREEEENQGSRRGERREAKNLRWFSILPEWRWFEGARMVRWWSSGLNDVVMVSRARGENEGDLEEWCARRKKGEKGFAGFRNPDIRSVLKIIDLIHYADFFKNLKKAILDRFPCITDLIFTY